MDTLKDAVNAELTRTAATTGILDNSVSPAVVNLYPLFLPQEPHYPAATYFVVVDNSEVAVDGTPVGLCRTRLQISAWSKDFDEADNIIEAIRTLYLGFIGTWGDLPVRVVEFSKGPQMYEQADFTYQVPCHLVIWHGENVR